MSRHVRLVRTLALLSLPVGCSPRNVAAPTAAAEAGTDATPEAAPLEVAAAPSGGSCRLLPPAGLTPNGVVQPMEIVVPCGSVCMQGSFAPVCQVGPVVGSVACGPIACAAPCTCENAGSGTCRCPWAGPMPGPLDPPDAVPFLHVG